MTILVTLLLAFTSGLVLAVTPVLAGNRVLHRSALSASLVLLLAAVALGNTQA
jgi:hypothetical protein